MLFQNCFINKVNTMNNSLKDRLYGKRKRKIITKIDKNKQITSNNNNYNNVYRYKYISMLLESQVDDESEGINENNINNITKTKINKDIDHINEFINWTRYNKSFEFIYLTYKKTNNNLFKNSYTLRCAIPSEGLVSSFLITSYLQRIMD